MNRRSRINDESISGCTIPLKAGKERHISPVKLCEWYCHAVRLICVCGTSLWSVNLRTVCSSSVTQHPHKNTHSSSKLAWAFIHTHFITPLQGLHPLTSWRQQKTFIIYLYIIVLEDFSQCLMLAFLFFFCEFQPPCSPLFYSSFSKKAPHYVTCRFLCTSWVFV